MVSLRCRDRRSIRWQAAQSMLRGGFRPGAAGQEWVIATPGACDRYEDARQSATCSEMYRLEEVSRNPGPAARSSSSTSSKRPHRPQHPVVRADHGGLMTISRSALNFPAAATPRSVGLLTRQPRLLLIYRPSRTDAVGAGISNAAQLVNHLQRLFRVPVSASRYPIQVHSGCVLTVKSLNRYGGSTLPNCADPVRQLAS